MSMSSKDTASKSGGPAGRGRNAGSECTDCPTRSLRIGSCARWARMGGHMSRKAQTVPRDDPWAVEEARYIRPEDKLDAEVVMDELKAIHAKLDELVISYEDLRRTRYRRKPARVGEEG